MSRKLCIDLRCVTDRFESIPITAPQYKLLVCHPEHLTLCCMH